MTKILEVIDGFGLAPSKVTARVADWKDQEFERFFAEYTNAVRSQKLIRPADRGSTDVFPDSMSGQLPVALVRQLCIYVNRIYLHDPLLELKETFDSLDTNFARIIRKPKRGDRIADYRSEFAGVVEQFLELRPLVDLGIVHVTPSQLAQRRREPGAIYASDLYGPTGRLSDDGLGPPVLELPPGLCDYINANLWISPAEFKNRKAVIHSSERVSKPTRTIAVRFSDGVAPMVFCLSSMSPSGKDDKGNFRFSMHYSLANDSGDLDENTFRNWVAGEAQKYVCRRLDELNNNLFLSAAAGAQFLTNVPSSRDLLSVDLGLETSESSTPHPTLLELDLPYLANVNISELAKARRDEATFEEFRIAFDKAFSEMTATKVEERQRRTDQLIRDLIQAPISRIDNRLRVLNRNVLIDSALAVGVFASTMLSGGSTLLGIACLAAAAKAVDSYKDAKSNQEEIRRDPSYFYWQATKGARDRSRAESPKR